MSTATDYGSDRFPDSPHSNSAAEANRVNHYLRVIHRMGLVSSEWTTSAMLKDLFSTVDLAGRRMLDIGGGSGIYSFYVAARGAREVVCLEPEADGCASAVTQVFQRIRKEIPDLPVRHDARTVQEYRDSEKFDIILMKASINHIDEDACVHLLQDRQAQEKFKGVFAHIATLARSGATLIVSDCTRHNLFAALGHRNPLCPTIEWHKHQAPEAWASLLQDAGFRNPKVSWEPLYRFGKTGQVLFGNKAAAYFLKSVFRLTMEKA